MGEQQEKVFYSFRGTSAMHYIRERNAVVVKEGDYPLVQITKQELSLHRDNETPAIILKVGEKYYFTEVPQDFRFTAGKRTREHLCTKCRRCFAKEYSEGGCDKVKASGEEKCIENFDFITLGYEVINAGLNSLVVQKCKLVK